MNREIILKSDILDIIFENRNKVYGAYDLRKYYNSRMNKAFGIMISMVVLAMVLLFLPEKKMVITRTFVIDETELGNPPKPKEKIPEQQPKKDPLQPRQPAVKYLSDIKFVNDSDTADNLNQDLNHANIGSVVITGPITGGPSIVIPVPTGTGDFTVPVIPKTDRTIPIDNPDIMPAYPGGWEALRIFLERNLQNPASMDEGEMVSVRVKFVVGYDGKLQGFVTSKAADEMFYKEVIRVLKKMPDWIPGKSNGENISVNYTIPVKFVPAE